MNRTPPAPAHALGTADAVSIVVGIIVGSSIFRAPATVFGGAGGPLAGLGVWLLGGLLSLLGAVCYAELACAYPGPAGDYGYLTRAFGRPAGTLFAWAQLAVIRTGAGIGGIAYVFADHAEIVFRLGPWLPFGLSGSPKAVWATLAVVGLTGVNALGVRPGKWTQHVLTGAKVLGLAGVVVAGAWLAFAGPSFVPAPAEGPGVAVALVFVMYAYGGWNEAAYVTAELRDPHRDTVRALVLGVSAVAGLYLIVNLAYLGALGYGGLCESKEPAAAVLGRVLGRPGAAAMSLLVMVSSLGAVQGMLFTGARLYGAFGSGHRFFARLGPRRGEAAPAGALAAQALFTVGLIAAVEAGPAWKSALGLPAGTAGDGFDTLVACTAPAFWLFFLAAGLTLPVLRMTDPATPRPFRVPLYPLPPVAFCAACAFMLWQSTAYALKSMPAEALLVAALLLPGLPLALTAGPPAGGLPERRTDR
jgi:amino acid transporter